MSTILQLDNIVKSFDMAGYKLDVLKDINVSVKSGSALAITGSSGAGKSTMLHIMGGLERPTSGKVLFRGQDIYKGGSAALDRYRNMHVGFVFQFHYLLDDFSAFENVLIPAVLAERADKAAEERAGALLERMGLKDRMSHFPKELSGGEQQRVALARALMNEPALLLADEPTGNLDKANSRAVQDLLFSLADEGMAIVIVTHDNEIALQATERLHLEKA